MSHRHPTPLFRLPYDIQEEITSYLLPLHLIPLASASRHLSSLAARALYANVSLHSAYQAQTPPLFRPLDSLRRRQFSFLLAISHHPEYILFIRHLAFQFIDHHQNEHSNEHLLSHHLIWNAFQKAKAVISIDIAFSPTTIAPSSSSSSLSPPLAQPLFPNLKSAKIDGLFPIGILDHILHTSSQLRSLHITANAAERLRVSKQSDEVQWPPHPLPWTLDAFIQRSVKAGAFLQLQSLRLDVHLSPNRTLDVESFATLLSESVTPCLTELEINLEDDKMDAREAWCVWDLDKTLCERMWTRVEKLCLRGVTMTPRAMELLEEQFPAVAAVEWTHPKDKKRIVRTALR